MTESAGQTKGSRLFPASTHRRWRSSLRPGNHHRSGILLQTSRVTNEHWLNGTTSCTIATKTVQAEDVPEAQKCQPRRGSGKAARRKPVDGCNQRCGGATACRRELPQLVVYRASQETPVHQHSPIADFATTACLSPRRLSNRAAYCATSFPDYRPRSSPAQVRLKRHIFRAELAEVPAGDRCSGTEAARTGVGHRACAGCHHRLNGGRGPLGKREALSPGQSLIAGMRVRRNSVFDVEKAVPPAAGHHESRLRGRPRSPRETMAINGVTPRSRHHAKPRYRECSGAHPGIGLRRSLVTAAVQPVSRRQVSRFQPYRYNKANADVLARAFAESSSTPLRGNGSR